MSTLTQIREAFKTTLDAAGIVGTTVYDEVPETIKAPAVVIEPDTSDFTFDFGGGASYMVDLVILVARTDSSRGQALADQYITPYGEKSVTKILRDNPSIGLSDTDVTVQGMHKYGAQFEVGGIKYIGAVLKVQVITGTD